MQDKPTEDMEDTLARQAVRPAREDDICILLSSNILEENTQILERQEVLQTILGGRIVTPVHLTSHRFDVPNGNNLTHLIDNLSQRLRRYRPFSLTAISYVPLYSSFRKVNLLKWRVRTDVEVYKFTMLVNELLTAAGIQSIFPPGWVSSLVTVLEDIPDLCYDRQELNQNLQFVKEPFPRHLFTANEIAFSRVKGPEEFELIEKIILP